MWYAWKDNIMEIESKIVILRDVGGRKWKDSGECYYKRAIWRTLVVLILILPLPIININILVVVILLYLYLLGKTAKIRIESKSYLMHFHINL